YEVRLKQCREAVARIAATGRAVKSLREVQPSDLDAVRSTMDDVLWRRAHHVVSENERTLEAVKVLQGGDLERFGELMNQSHESLRDDYEVSSKELDTLVRLGRDLVDAPSTWCEPRRRKVLPKLWRRNTVKRSASRVRFTSARHRMARWFSLSAQHAGKPT